MTAQERIGIILFGVVFTACVAPILLLLNYFGRSDLMVPTLGSAATISTTIKVFPEFRKRTWFWMTMVVISGLHLLLILYFPWRSGWVPAQLTILVAIVDFAIIVGVVRVIEKLMNYLSGDSFERG